MVPFLYQQNRSSHAKTGSTLQKSSALIRALLSKNRPWHPFLNFWRFEFKNDNSAKHGESNKNRKIKFNCHFKKYIEYLRRVLQPTFSSSTGAQTIRHCTRSAPETLSASLTTVPGSACPPSWGSPGTPQGWASTAASLCPVPGAPDARTINVNLDRR